MATNTNAADRAEWAAEERAVANADLFADWLCGEVAFDIAPAELPPQPHIDPDFDEMPTADLYRLAIDSGQKPAIRLLALDSVRDRFMKAKADYIGRLALESLEAA